MNRLKEVLAFANNKGGVAKTTTVQNVAAGLLRRDPSLRILCIDLDPQGNLSSLLGWREKIKQMSIISTVADALRDGDKNHLPVYKSDNGLFYSPASTSLADIDPDLHRQMQSKLVLASLFGNDISYMDALYLGAENLGGSLIEECFDYVLIDCAPALSELTYNALGAASGVIIPVQLGSLSVDGIGRMIEAYRNVQRKLNSDLVMRGLLIVMADERTNLTRETTEFLRYNYEAEMFHTRIRQCVKVGESQFQHQDIFSYAPDCTAAHDYDDFITELLETTSPSD
ncbi:ParA family protein [Prevotella sp. MGM1]|uniref:ParA family protein n=1 Tax=Prevotella sp. MGM1 TaxID=2033405 RepID=UPI000CE9EE63|nr:ParA family protein [Prevotella sp. MGM1]GAY28470.1 ParA family protein [Prevotella sp. MGM1]